MSSTAVGGGSEVIRGTPFTTTSTAASASPPYESRASSVTVNAPESE